MFRDYILNPFYHVQVFPGEGVLLTGEKCSQVLKGDACEEVISHLLQGKFLTHQSKLFQKYNAVELNHLILSLIKKEILILKSKTQPDHELAFSYALNMPEAPLSIQLINLSSISGNFLIKQLKYNNIVHSDHAKQVVVVCNDYISVNVKDFFKKIDPEYKYILFKPSGTEFILGPVIEKTTLPCYTCLRNRMLSLIPTSWALKNSQDFNIHGRAYNLSSLKMAIHYLSFYLLKANRLPNFPNDELLSFDYRDMEFKLHKIIAYRNCQHCGQDYPAIPRKIELLSRPVLANRFAYREYAPHETYEKYKHLVSHLCGIVPHLKANNEGPIFSYVSGENHALNHKSLSHMWNMLRSQSGGKGQTAMQAKVGALAEAIERYSGRFDPHDSVLMASYKEIKTRAIHPNCVMLYSHNQYAKQNYWSTLGSEFNTVPPEFNEEEQIAWTEVYSLTNHNYKYFARDLLYYYCQDHHTALRPNSNGCASGNSLEEAILQGLFELIERDCVALWWYNKISFPSVDITSIQSEYIVNLLSYYEEIQRKFWVLDITHDLGVPCFVAISYQFDKAEQCIAMGFGCHLSPEIAVIRAITEHNQMLASIIKFSVIGYDKLEPLLYNWLKFETVSNHSYLLPKIGSQPISVNRLTSTLSNDLKTDIERLTQEFKKKNLEIFVSNQTKPEIGMPVVRVIVPGLRHFWARFAPGRLYDVPVKLGWQPQALNENDLNHIPMFM